MTSDPRPLVVHVVHRFDIGGLENGVVNLVNRLPVTRYRHCIVALTEITEFRRRVERDDVRFVALHRAPGQSLWLFPRMRRLLLEMRPAIVHTRNLAALEMSLPAVLAGVPVRIHGEHGWDVQDPDGVLPKYRLVRRAFRPFVHRYVALSHAPRSATCSITSACRPSASRRSTTASTPRASRRRAAGAPRCRVRPSRPASTWLVGTVGRLQAVKDQTHAGARLRAGARVCARRACARMRLVMVGDGPLARRQSRRCCARPAWPTWPGSPASATTCPSVLRGLDCFVAALARRGHLQHHPRGDGERRCRSSPRASAATPELVDDGMTGRLVPPRTSRRWRVRCSTTSSIAGLRAAHAAARRAHESKRASAWSAW